MAFKSPVTWFSYVQLHYADSKLIISAAVMKVVSHKFIWSTWNIDNHFGVMMLRKQQGEQKTDIRTTQTPRYRFGLTKKIFYEYDIFQDSSLPYYFIISLTTEYRSFTHGQF